MKKKIIIIVAAAVVAIGVILSWQYLSLIRGAVGCDYYLRLPSGGNTRVIFDSLQQSGAVKNMTTLRKAAAVFSLGDRYNAGGYRLKKGMNYITLVRTLKHGLQTPLNVTFNNIRSLDGLSGRLAQQLEADSADFARVLTDPATAVQCGFDRRTFIAMFIPDTYQFYWNTSPVRFTERMNKQWLRFWNDERRAKLEKIGLTPVEASILASIVYEETKKSDEMPTVAGVYINRLRIRMLLQADPTAKFAVGDPTMKRIWERHLKVDSPYNTYKYPGLPPGPICMPSVTAIDAVLNYKQHDYLYFCARPDYSGYHNFARTLAQHNHNRSLYQQFLGREGIR